MVVVHYTTTWKSCQRYKESKTDCPEYLHLAHKSMTIPDIHKNPYVTYSLLLLRVNTLRGLLTQQPSNYQFER